MKKYLLIGDGESPHILKWARELTKHFELYLVSSRDVDPGIREILPEERIHAFRLNVAESGGNLKFYRMILPLIRIINQIKPDYVNAHYITSHGLLAALAKKIARKNFVLIQTAWGTDILVTPFRNKFYKGITRFALKQAQLVTSDSRLVAEIVQGLCSTPTTTFPFGLDFLPEVLPEEKDPNLFFSNRTLIANSNIDRVLHFFSKVHDSNHNAKLIIANEGPMKNSLTELSEQLGISPAVNFVGFITPDEQDELYRKSQFYFSVLSSDALSVSLLEAMAHGCIPIVSDLPDNRDWVKDGENGIVLLPGTRPDVITDIQKKSTEIFENNRELIQKNAIFPGAIIDYCNLLNELKNNSLRILQH